jgi:hypothetical protein
MATTATTESEPGPGTVGNFPPHRITVERFERMVEADVLGEAEPIFLWKGRLVAKMTGGRRHSISVLKLDRLLAERFHVEVEQAMAIGDDGVPGPDSLVVIPNGRIEVHEGPSGPADSPTYRRGRVYDRGEVVPVPLDGREVGRVAVDAIFPR